MSRVQPGKRQLPVYYFDLLLFRVLGVFSCVLACPHLADLTSGAPFSIISLAQGIRRNSRTYSHVARMRNASVTEKRQCQHEG